MVSGDKSRVLVARSDLFKHLKAKHDGCRVRAKVRAMGREGINVVGWASRVDAQRSQKDTSASFDGRTFDGREIEEQKQIREGFRGYFAQLFRRNEGTPYRIFSLADCNSRHEKWRIANNQ